MGEDSDSGLRRTILWASLRGFIVRAGAISTFSRAVLGAAGGRLVMGASTIAANCGTVRRTGKCAFRTGAATVSADGFTVLGAGRRRFVMRAGTIPTFSRAVLGAGRRGFRTTAHCIATHVGRGPAFLPHEKHGGQNEDSNPNGERLRVEHTGFSSLGHACGLGNSHLLLL